MQLEIYVRLRTGNILHASFSLGCGRFQELRPNALDKSAISAFTDISAFLFLE